MVLDCEQQCHGQQQFTSPSFGVTGTTMRMNGHQNKLQTMTRLYKFIGGIWVTMLPFPRNTTKPYLILLIKRGF